VSALTGDRNTLRRDGVQFEFPVAADTIIYAGALVALAGGVAYPGAAPGDPLSGVVVGVAEARADNAGGAAGDIRVKVRRGVYRFANGDAIDLTDIGANAYVAGAGTADDQTVQAASVDTVPAGVIRDVDDQGVWVDVGTFA
jgi:hypothetical protein